MAYVNIVGIITTQQKTELAFVECKNEAITVGHLSQILGYSRVALPRYSFIVAPQEPSDSLLTLLKTFNRLDILHYRFPNRSTPTFDRRRSLG